MESMNCLHCGKEIERNQYFVESEDDYKKRLASGYCRSKCKRLGSPAKSERSKPPLELVSANYQRGKMMEQVKETTPRDASYLDFVRTFDCIGCGWPAHLKKIDAHHIETGGTSIKCSDYLTVPLCAADARGCHDAADKSPETADGFRPYALMLNTLWIKAGHRMKK
jgi:hypothetical protein